LRSRRPLRAAPGFRVFWHHEDGTAARPPVRMAWNPGLAEESCHDLETCFRRSPTTSRKARPQAQAVCSNRSRNAACCPPSFGRPTPTSTRLPAPRTRAMASTGAILPTGRVTMSPGNLEDDVLVDSSVVYDNYPYTVNSLEVHRHHDRGAWVLPSLPSPRPRSATLIVNNGSAVQSATLPERVRRPDA